MLKKNKHRNKYINIVSLLMEDRVLQDITTQSIVSKNKMCEFRIISKNKDPFILCGGVFVSEILDTICAQYKIVSIKNDGSVIGHGEVMISGESSARELLQVERVCLNLIQHLSGVSTKTNLLVKTLNDSKIKILDTRKTVPFMRKAQKYAVVIGGGANHRMDLSEMILIKDNHIALCGNIKDVINFARKSYPNKTIEIECDTIIQVDEACKYMPDIILLDNMTISQINDASNIIRTKSNAKIEVSGGITLTNIANYTGLDIDFISIGDITHSVAAVDISMEIDCIDR